MIVRWDEDSGRASVDLHGDGRWVRLRRPKVRQWADWSDQAEALADRLRMAMRSAESDAEAMRLHDDIVLAGPQADLNWEMIHTLAAADVGPPRLPADDPLRLVLSDSKVTTQFLTFWWSCPLAPWDLDRPPEDEALAPAASSDSGRGKDKDAKKIGTQLPGALGHLSVIYQALSVIGMGGGFAPPNIDDWELWQVAVVLGRDGPAGEYMEGGGEVKHRSDGQVDTMGFGRDPDQPRFFGPGADPRRAWDYIKRRRAARRRRDEAAQRRGDPTGRDAPPPRHRRRRGGPWRPS